MNTKIALSALSILSALALMSGATFAFFTDSGTSSGNVFTTGSLDLQLSNNGTTFTDNVSATFGGTNMVPNGTPVVGTLTLKNNGTVNASTVGIAVANVITEGTGPGAVTTNPMPKYLRVTALTYGGADILPSQTPDSNGNGFVDLEDLQTNGIKGLSGIDATLTKALGMSVQLDTTAPNDLQGDSVSTTFTVTMSQ